MKAINKKIRRLREFLYALFDARFSFSATDKVLFVDLGSNLGQAYQWFSRFFNHNNVEFVLFEPNPYCNEVLRNLPYIKSGKVELNECGVGIRNASVKFYGLSENDRLSKGGSILKDHNSFRHNSSDNGILIDIIDFSDYIQRKSTMYDKIIVKMDIEGAEVELLEKMIDDQTIQNICVLYVEFHSQFKSAEQVKSTQKRESRIINFIRKETKTRLRLWH